jgi:mono/diheme cytochrome c family protein
MHMKTTYAIAITVAVGILVILAICYEFLRSGGLSARKKPSTIEYAIANYALSLSIPTAPKKARNPVSPTSGSLIDAKKYYSDNCAVCHANDGTGKTNTARGLSPEVPDLHAEHVQKLTDGEMFYIIKNGVRLTGMPGWDLRDEEVWKLVLLIRQFGSNNTSRQLGKRIS